MDHLGLEEVPSRLAAYRSLRTSTVLVSTRPWTPAELAIIRAYLERNGYDPIALPGLTEGEVNRFNRIPDDPYPALFRSLVAERPSLERSYPYRIDPPTDDRPFFFHFFRWAQTPEVLAALGRTWQPFGGSGYLVLLALAALMLILGMLLVALPALSRRAAGRLSARGGLYFGCLGAGFLFVELSVLQRLTLPLERPSIAFAVVVSTLLLTSGLGSAFSDRVRTDRSVLILSAVVFLGAAVLPAVLPVTLGWNFGSRVLAAILMLLPLGFLMGIPFPLGLRTFTAGEAGRIGWAWSINGAASGVAGVLAAMAAIDVGLRAVMVLGGLAYFGAWLALRRPAIAVAP